MGVSDLGDLSQWQVQVTAGFAAPHSEPALRWLLFSNGETSLPFLVVSRVSPWFTAHILQRWGNSNSRLRQSWVFCITSLSGASKGRVHLISWRFVALCFSHCPTSDRDEVIRFSMLVGDLGCSSHAAFVQDCTPPCRISFSYKTQVLHKLYFFCQLWHFVVSSNVELLPLGLKINF